MTKGSVATDLDELSEELLEDLDHRERFALLLRAVAEGREHWRERLTETMSTMNVHGPDPAHGRRARVLMSMANRAVFELQRLHSEFELARARAAYNDLRERCPEHDEAEIPVATLMPSAGRGQDQILDEIDLEYHAYRKFAEVIVGVDLGTWVVTHHRGQQLIETVEATLKREPEHAERASEGLPEVECDPDPSIKGVPDELPAEPFDRLVLARYTDLVNLFEAQIETATPEPGQYNWQS